MAFAEIELARIAKIVGGFCKRRVPLEVRDKLRLEYSVKGHDIEIFEVRPHWRDKGRESRSGVAKIKYVRSANEWRLYWMRRDLKWHSYEPFSSARNLETIVDGIDRDELCCFFG